MSKRRTWNRIHLTQLRTQTEQALAGFCVWQSDRGELILPLVRGLGTTTPRLEGWKLCAVSKRTGKLETIDYHAHGRGARVSEAKRQVARMASRLALE